MAIFRISHREEDCSITLYNYGCNWDCCICSYKITENLAPRHFLATSEILDAMAAFRMERLAVIGGEPLICADLDRIVARAKEAGAWVKIPHTNASILPPEGVDEVGVSIRAISKRKHMQLTGAPNQGALSNIYKIYDRGIQAHFSTILIPEIVDALEVERIAEFLKGIDPSLSLHVISYIPVPGLPWRSPTRNELEVAVQAASKHLSNVTSSRIGVREFLDQSFRDAEGRIDGATQ